MMSSLRSTTYNTRDFRALLYDIDKNMTPKEYGEKVCSKKKTKKRK